MNKIIMSNDEIIKSLDDKITCEINYQEINKIKINVLKNTKLFIELNTDSKLDISIELNKNTNLELIELVNCNKLKKQVKYNLNDNSKLKIIKLHTILKSFQQDIINLNGINSKVDLVLKTIGEKSLKYDFLVNHKNNSTESNLILNGVNISGNTEFNVTSYVLNNKKDCVLNQNNHIVNLTNDTCTIRPILLIDEVDVLANHSAYIGDFKEEEYFYLERLGITKEEATKLLLKGFLHTNCPKKQVNLMFKKYWR